MRKNKNDTQGVVERSDSHIAVKPDELKRYQEQMKQMFGDTKLPAVMYKGQQIPKRVLSDYSYLVGERSRAA